MSEQLKLPLFDDFHPSDLHLFGLWVGSGPCEIEAFGRVGPKVVKFKLGQKVLDSDWRFVGCDLQYLHFETDRSHEGYHMPWRDEK